MATRDLRSPLPPDDERSAPALRETPEAPCPDTRATTLAPPPLSAALAYRTLDLFALGVVLVDRSLTCVFANRAARAILRAGPVVLAGVKLVCSPQELCITLLRAIRRALANADGPRVEAEVVSVPAEPEPLRFVLSNLPTPANKLAVLFIGPPAQARQSDAELLRRLFGLTRLEAEVAELLCHGQTPSEIARALRLSPHTVRAHLRGAFAKTGAHRQAELVRLVLLGAGALRL